MINEFQKLLVIKTALGTAMTQKQQLFVSSNWQDLPQFLSTDEGKIALQTFVNDWSAQAKDDKQP